MSAEGQGGGVVLVSGDFVETGGMDRANHALASYLLRRGGPVHLVGHRADRNLTEQGGATFHRVPKPLNSYLLGAPLLARAGRRVARRVASDGGRAIVNGGNCDWGDVNWVHYLHAAWRPRGTGTVARRIKTELAHRSALRDERRAIARARVVVANSKKTKEQLIDFLNCDQDRIHTLYYGTDPARFRPATDLERIEARARLGWGDDRPALVFVGALGDDRKGFDTLFAAWRRLCDDPGWDARLVVVGAGASLERWRAAARGERGSVEFLGFRRDVPEILRAADALVSPTRHEAYGLNVHEALCCGLPAFVSQSSGIAERYPVSLVDLLLPDPDDPSDLAARLRSWRSDPSRLRPALAAFSATLRARSWDDMAEEFVGVMNGQK